MAIQTFKLGDTVTGELNTDTGVFILKGTGDTYDYTSSNYTNRPFQSYLSQMTSLVVENGITRIGNCLFKDCSSFKSNLTIPNSITSMGESAFENCRNFTGDLVIPNSVTSIGKYVFYECTGFNGTLTLSNSLNIIKMSMFYNCSKFKGNLVIPDSVTTIENYAFYNCSGLTGSLIIPNSVTTIGRYAFSHCTGFNGTLTLSNTLTSIGEYTFELCNGFTGDLIIPNSVTSMGEGVFKECRHFSGKLILGNGLTTIPPYAFSICDGFTGDLTIPNNITTIGNDGFFFAAFQNATLNLHENITSFGKTSFWGNCFKKIVNNCKNSQAIEMNAFGNSKNSELIARGWSSNTNFKSHIDSLGYTWKELGVEEFKLGETVTGELNTKTGVFTLKGSGATYDYTYPDRTKRPFYSYLSQITSLVIEDGITTIGGYLFENCTNLKGNLTIPNSVTSVGDSAFENCSGLTGSLIIPNSVTIIKQNAFYKCSGLTGSLIIPNSVTTIGRYAFSHCTGFNGTLTLSNTLTSIGESTFKDCNNFNGGLTIPNSVTSLGAYSFYGCRGFTGDLVIPNSVTSIESNTFCDCRGFNGTLTLGNGLTEIRSYAFSGCSNLAGEVNLPSSIEDLWGNVFDGCYRLNTLINHSEESQFINKNAFVGLPSGILIKGWSSNTNFKSHIDSLGYTWKELGVEEFKLGETVTGELNTKTGVFTLKGTGATYDYTVDTRPMKAFESQLTSLVVEDGITTIGNNLFVHCLNLTGEILLSESISKIGENVFAFTKLTSIKNNRVSNQIISNSAFLIDSSIPKIDLYGYGSNIEFKKIIDADSRFKWNDLSKEPTIISKTIEGNSLTLQWVNAYDFNSYSKYEIYSDYLGLKVGESNTKSFSLDISLYKNKIYDLRVRGVLKNGVLSKYSSPIYINGFRQAISEKAQYEISTTNTSRNVEGLFDEIFVDSETSNSSVYWNEGDCIELDLKSRVDIYRRGTTFKKDEVSLFNVTNNQFVNQQCIPTGFDDWTRCFRIFKDGVYKFTSLGKRCDSEWYIDVLPPAPTPPQELRFVVDNGVYKLLWSKSPMATSYEIYKDGSLVDTVETNEYTLTSESEKTFYVLATSEYGKSEKSNEVLVKTQPNAPSGLSVSHHVNSNGYVFDIGFIDNSQIENYYLLKYTVDNGEEKTRRVDASVESGKEINYSFVVNQINQNIVIKVVAVNDIGESNELIYSTLYIPPTPRLVYDVELEEVIIVFTDTFEQESSYVVRYAINGSEDFLIDFIHTRSGANREIRHHIPLDKFSTIELSIACVINDVIGLYSIPQEMSRELDKNTKAPKNFNYEWTGVGEITFSWEDIYTEEKEFELLLDFDGVKSTVIVPSTTIESVDNRYTYVYRFSGYGVLKAKIRMAYELSKSAYSQEFLVLYREVSGKPPSYITKKPIAEGYHIQWEAQDYVFKYDLSIIRDGVEETIPLDYDSYVLKHDPNGQVINYEIFVRTRFVGGVTSKKSSSLIFSPTELKSAANSIFYDSTLEKEYLHTTTMFKNYIEKFLIPTKITGKNLTKTPITSKFCETFQIDYFGCETFTWGKGIKESYDLHTTVFAQEEIQNTIAITTLSYYPTVEKYDMGTVLNTLYSQINPVCMEINKIRIVTIGDSITAGHPNYWAETGTGNEKSQYQYWLNRKLKGAYEIINKGYGSDTTDKILDRFKRDVLPYNGQYCIIQGGTNDIYWAMAESQGNKDILDKKLANMKFNILQMVSICKDNNIIPIIGTLIPRTGATGIYKTALYNFNEWIKEYANENEGVSYIDFFNAGKDNIPPTPLEDPTNAGALNPMYDGDAIYDEYGNIIKQGRGIHPSPEGYKIMADAIPSSLFSLAESGFKLYLDEDCMKEEFYDDSDKLRPYYIINIDNIRRGKVKKIVRYIKNIGDQQAIFALYCNSNHNLTVWFENEQGEKSNFANGLLNSNKVSKITISLLVGDDDSKSNLQMYLAGRNIKLN